MLLTLDDAKTELKADWHRFADNQYPQDTLTEYADDACPVYTKHIIEQWTLMPSEFDDAWRDFTDNSDNSKGIVDLMLLDLYNYYSHLYNLAYNELADEMEATE